MTGKNLRKIIKRLSLMCYMLKKWIYVLPTFQNAYVSKHKSKHETKNHSFNDSEQKKMALSCSKKTIHYLCRS